MKRTAIFCVGILATTVVAAENLEGVEQMVCSSGQAQICLETGDCYAAMPWELSIPDFVVIDTDKQLISTTKASGENRSSKIAKVEKSDGLIYLQGAEGDRVFSFVIHESTGRMTVAIARDGMAVTVFGACTDINL